MIKKNCLKCKKEFYVYPSLDRVKYCSYDCYWLEKTGKKRPQNVKDRISETMKVKGLRGPIRYGAKCNFWKGGIDKIHKTLWRLIRDSLKYKQWRNAIFKRDNYTCQICGQRGGELHVDHYPYPFSTILNTFIDVKTVEDSYKIGFLWDIENGRTLCKLCDQKYGNKEYTKTSETLFGFISRNSQQRCWVEATNN